MQKKQNDTMTNLLVFVKPIPSSDVPITEEGTLLREQSPWKLSASDASALELALQWGEKSPLHRVVTLSLAPEKTGRALLRETLARGASHAIHLCDSIWKGADIVQTTELLCAAIRKESPDLCLFGSHSEDSGSGALAAAVAARLQWPLIASVQSLSENDGKYKIKAWEDDSILTFNAHPPIVISCRGDNVNLRLPNMRRLFSLSENSYERWTTKEISGIHRQVFVDSTQVMQAGTHRCLVYRQSESESPIPAFLSILESHRLIQSSRSPHE